MLLSHPTNAAIRQTARRFWLAATRLIISGYHARSGRPADQRVTLLALYGDRPYFRVRRLSHATAARHGDDALPAASQCAALSLQRRGIHAYPCSPWVRAVFRQAQLLYHCPNSAL